MLNFANKRGSSRVFLNTVYFPNAFVVEKEGEIVTEVLADRSSKVVGNFLKFMEEILSCEDSLDVYYIAGPGSFTGIKVAFSLMKAFKKVDNIFWYGLNLLEVLAHFVEEKEKILSGEKKLKFAVYFSAHQGDVFAAFKGVDSVYYLCSSKSYFLDLVDSIGIKSYEFKKGDFPRPSEVLEILNKVKFFVNRPLYIKSPVIGKKK